MIVCALYRRGLLASMAMVVVNKRASSYLYDLDCRFLKNSHRLSVLFWVATECKAESNDCLCIISAWSFSVTVRLGMIQSVRYSVSQTTASSHRLET